MTSQVSHAQGQLLAQVVPGVTTPVTLFTAGELRVEVTLITVANRNGGNVTLNLYHDDDGTVFDATTDLGERQLSPTDQPPTFQAQHAGSGIMISPGGSLGVEVSQANDVTISVYGVTETLAERVRPGVR